MTDIMIDEANRVSAKEVFSEFEEQIQSEIFSWSKHPDNMFFSLTKDIINAFWTEKLN
jgi:hypothetical protein